MEYLTICDSKFLIPGIYICTFSETQQKFNGGYRSWGSFFVNLSDFYDSKQGYLLNDTCIIEAHVCFSDLSTLEANNLKKITPTKDSKSGDQAARNSESTQQGDDKEAETEIETKNKNINHGSIKPSRDLLKNEKEESYVNTTE